MKVMDGLNKAVSTLAQSAQKGMNTAKLEVKIRIFKKEINEIYCRIGKLFYSSRTKNKSVSSDELDNLYNEIDTYLNKIKGLEKQISVIKSVSEAKGESTEACSTNYTKLNKTEHDLKIIRTEEGIKFLKFCPDCQSGNEPEALVCSKCGHKFN